MRHYSYVGQIVILMNQSEIQFQNTYVLLQSSNFSYPKSNFAIAFSNGFINMTILDMVKLDVISLNSLSLFKILKSTQIILVQVAMIQLHLKLKHQLPFLIYSKFTSWNLIHWRCSERNSRCRHFSTIDLFDNLLGLILLVTLWNFLE